jgi:hypothetical protein
LGEDQARTIQRYPELPKMGKSQAAYEQLARTIEEAWDALDQELLNEALLDQKECCCCDVEAPR